MAGEASIFAKIIRKEIPSDFVHEDDKCVVIRDIAPKAPHHFLVLPKKPVQRLADAEDSDAELLGHLLLVARKVAKDQKLDKGFRVVVNDGPEGGQEVYYLHVHVLGGRQMTWPPG